MSTCIIDRKEEGTRLSKVLNLAESKKFVNLTSCFELHVGQGEFYLRSLSPLLKQIHRWF